MLHTEYEFDKQVKTFLSNSLFNGKSFAFHEDTIGGKFHKKNRVKLSALLPNNRILNYFHSWNIRCKQQWGRKIGFFLHFVETFVVLLRTFFDWDFNMNFKKGYTFWQRFAYFTKLLWIAEINSFSFIWQWFALQSIWVGKVLTWIYVLYNPLQELH